MAHKRNQERRRKNTVQCNRQELEESGKKIKVHVSPCVRKKFAGMGLTEVGDLFLLNVWAPPS